MWKTKIKKWPKIDSCSEVQAFVDQMCLEYDVPAIKVIVKSKSWVEWFAGAGVWACAFWWAQDDKSDEDFVRYIAFDGQKCRISGKDRSIPIKIKHRHQVAERVHTVIHEFIHHYFHHYFKINTDGHGSMFRKMEREMNAEYGIYFFYSRDNYARMFHNFWGFGFGKRKPNATDRGWIEVE